MLQKVEHRMLFDMISCQVFICTRNGNGQTARLKETLIGFETRFETKNKK